MFLIRETLEERVEVVGGRGQGRGGDIGNSIHNENKVKTHAHVKIENIPESLGSYLKKLGSTQ